jgi:hypothetical protein
MKLCVGNGSTLASPSPPSIWELGVEGVGWGLDVLGGASALGIRRAVQRRTTVKRVLLASDQIVLNGKGLRKGLKVLNEDVPCGERMNGEGAPLGAASRRPRIPGTPRRRVRA